MGAALYTQSFFFGGAQNVRTLGSPSAVIVVDASL